MDTEPLFINESEVIRRIEELEAVKTSVLNGTATVNEARASLGLDAIDGGEQAVGLKPFPIITVPVRNMTANEWIESLGLDPVSVLDGFTTPMGRTRVVKTLAEKQAAIPLPDGWRWVKIGERVIPGDVMHDGSAEPVTVTHADCILMEGHHPVRRKLLRDVPLLNLGGKRAIDLDD